MMGPNRPTTLVSHIESKDNLKLIHDEQKGFENE